MKKSVLVAMLFGALAMSACGQSTDTAAALSDLDPDKDGTIDLTEAKNGGAKKFADLNPDNDKTLDAKELSGRLDAAAIKAADPDNDGTLDSKEYEAVVEQRFKAADPDNDGTVDKKELDTPAGQELLKIIH